MRSANAGPSVEPFLHEGVVPELPTSGTNTDYADLGMTVAFAQRAGLGVLGAMVRSGNGPTLASQISILWRGFRQMPVTRVTPGEFSHGDGKNRADSRRSAGSGQDRRKPFPRLVLCQAERDISWAFATACETFSAPAGFIVRKRLFGGCGDGARRETIW